MAADTSRQVRESAFANRAARSNFPLLSEHPELCYLDNAATTQVPEEVLAAQADFERTCRSNVHRGIYSLAEQASDAYDQARKEVAFFLGAGSDEVVFTHGATESLNLAAMGWGRANLKEGDLVLLDTSGHHSLAIPWLMLARQIGIETAFIGVDGSGRFDQARWEALLEAGPKAVALGHTSNVTGFTADLGRLSHEAHRAGAVVVADCAQSAGHRPFSFHELEIDFAAVSAHKMYGPFGIGALCVAEERLSEMELVLGGGGMVDWVWEDGFEALEGVAGFEAGTPNITGAIGFARACAYMQTLGIDLLADHCQALCDDALSLLSGIEGLSVLGGTSPGERASLLSFVIEGVHPHDVAEVLSDADIAVRAGHHCAIPLHQAMEIPASVRVSFAAYSNEAEVGRLVAALEGIREVFCNGA